MALTKAVAAVDAWAEVAAATTREGATVNCAGMYEAQLHIDACLAEATAEAIGATIYVEVCSETANDENWSVLTSFGGPTGTAIKADFTGTVAAGETVIPITNPGTLNLDHPAKFLFIENSTPASSEIVFQVSNEGDAGDSITILDGLKYEQTAAASDIWEIDAAPPSSVVVQYVVALPMSTNRARVVYNNKNCTGADIFTRCRISSVTAV
jgi:hypothetical protein